MLTASGGPFRGRSRERARKRHGRGGARTSDLDDGTKDHCGLRDAREQGARADRGALALRHPVRADRGRRASELDRALARALPRRSAARASRPARHARADLVRAHVPGAAAPSPQSRSTSRAGSTSASRRPTRRRSRCCPGPQAGERGGTFPCAYNAANEVAVAAFLDGADRLPGDRRHRRRRRSSRSTALRRAISHDLVAADAEAAALPSEGL